MQINSISLILFILVFNILFTSSLKSDRKESKSVYSKINFKWLEKDLLVQLNIYNANKYKIYFPLYRWDIYGDSISNGYYFYSKQEAWVNQMLFFPDCYNEINYMRDSYFRYEGGGFPNFFTIKPFDSILVNIRMTNFINKMAFDSNYRFQIITPYLKYEKLGKAIKYLKLNKKEIIKKRLTDTINMICLKPIDSTVFVQHDFWYPTNYKDFCSKHNLTEKEADSVQHILYRIDTIQCEKVLMKKNN